MFDASVWGQADLEFMQHGAVNLFWRRALLDDARQALEALSYDVQLIDCEQGWSSFQTQMSSLLRWDEQFGYSPWNGNLDALNDGLSGYPFPSSNKAALALVGFHSLVRNDRRSSGVVLDLLEYHSRQFLLFSKRLIVLVQTDDNRFVPPLVGGRTPQWNREEWMNKNRGL
ncbi:hypothetical protein [Sphingomonas sp.]|uniref:hypothetical protein n=1 Tax=Sphingomonas sp. TaxID=28214 RepID=UPI0025D259C0|nr:hypothetical protein [Sphingomonas sp.]